MKLPVVNHKDYFAKIGDDHKFPVKKFGELSKYLLDKKIVEKFYEPLACSNATLKRAHSEDYINHIKNKTLNEEGVKRIGFPLVDSVVQRSLLATGGTVLASKLAINFGVACNTAGQPAGPVLYCTVVGIRGSSFSFAAVQKKTQQIILIKKMHNKSLYYIIVLLYRL